MGAWWMRGKGGKEGDMCNTVNNKLIKIKTGVKEEDQMFWLSQKGQLHYL